LNWDAIGAVGEILGALAVVITLVYLAKQLRENTTSNRISSSWAMMQSFNSMHETMVSAPQFSEAAIRAFNEQELTPAEQGQINSLILHYLNTLVVAEESYRSGQLSEDLWAWTKRDLEWTLQGGMKGFLINQLKIIPTATVERLYGREILREVEEAGARKLTP
jgi:hypothetical protein